MSLLLSRNQKPLNHESGLVAAVAAHVPKAVLTCSAPPPSPAVFLTRKDLARIFGKHPDTVKTWERNGWIEAIRRPSGRIFGYPADEVARIASHLFSHFTHADFNRGEAKGLRVLELLEWVYESVRTAQSLPPRAQLGTLDLIALSSLAETTAPLPGSLQVTLEELSEHRDQAMRQLSERLNDAESRQVLLSAWRQAGAIAKTNKARRQNTNAD
jgi:hypothetical protein